jgi:hypothetical protein
MTSKKIDFCLTEPEFSIFDGCEKAFGQRRNDFIMYLVQKDMEAEVWFYGCG